MKSFWRWLRKWWWIFVAVAGAVFVIAWRLMAAKSKEQPPAPPSFADRAKEEVERIRLEGEVEKARVTAQAEAQRAEIDRIEEVGATDPAAARQQLADWLTRNL